MAEQEDKKSFTSFLFGNVDTEGNLEEDFLDEETKAHLSNLNFIFRKDHQTFEHEESTDSEAEHNDESDGTESKAGSAQDFADIDEFAEEINQPCCSNSLTVESSESSDDSDSDEYEFDGDNEEEEETTRTAMEEIENPLASMLPEKYRNIDVKKFFPHFRKNKVLRFSKVFGPGKPSSLPRIWRGVKNRRKIAAGSISKTPRASEVEERNVQETAKAVESIVNGERFKSVVTPKTPPLDECETDDDLKLMKPEQLSQKSNKGKSDRDESRIAPWRYGPAAYWYDQMGVSSTGEGFNYSMKLKPKSTQPETEKKEDDFAPELFLPLNMIRWEDNIIWNADDVRQDVLKTLTSGRQPLCGWIPTQQTRTFESFMTMLKSGGFSHVFGNKSSSTFAAQAPKASNTNLDSAENRANFCVFPSDNLELIYGDWEKDIIIDPNNMERIPEPKVLTLDPSDDPLLYGIPEDIPKDDLNASDDLNSNKSSDRKEHQFTKKSQMILGKVAQRQREEEEEAANAQMLEKDPFNLSNDEYYLTKGSSAVNTFGGSMIQHSIPGQNLAQPFFPTHLNIFKLRHFHRLPLKRPVRSVLIKPAFHAVQSLEKNVAKVAKLREQQRIASGGGEMFFMREPDDLSGRDGELILCEYSEDHPSLIMQPGMATKIKNFYKRKPGKENATEPKFDFGETSYTHTSPFLGTLSPGESLQALENNLFRAPIYQHNLPSTDFLVIRDKYGYYVRNIATLYNVGQECPVYEVPSPNSKRASNFVRDYLLVFIYRLFWSSKDVPRRIKMEDIRRAFPHYAESSIRKRLKLCSDFKRLGQGPESNYWVLRSDFRLPSLEEIRALVSPEMCCAYFSMLAAEQRLKDAGYGERYFFTPEEDDDDNEQVKMADEIKCAPWNTSRAYISAMKGKCLLDLTGVADPTGCGEGFSYVRVTAKPPKDEAPPPVKRTVTGTDADLRKLSLKDAKQLLRDFGVKDDEIKTLTRWEIIDVIRTLSTQQARSGGTGITKFARGSTRFSLAEVQDRYKMECQRIFDLQNRVLASNEYLSTDEEESEEGDSDIEEMGKNIETMLANKKPAPPVDDEKKEREDLQRLLRGEPLERKIHDEKNRQKKIRSHEQDEENDGRKLKIYRTFRDKNGREYSTIEVVTKSQLIEAYVKIRTTKEEGFIKHFAQMDEQFKEEKRREKRRLQDQLRRIRRNELKAKQGLPVGRPQKTEKPRKTPPPPKPSLLKMRCSACGGSGHMKTNKNCPLYGKVKLPSHNVAMPDDQLEQEFELSSSENLLTVEGTKIKFSKSIVEQTEKMKRKALKLKFPKNVVQQHHLFSSSLSVSASAPALLSPSSDDETGHSSMTSSFDLAPNQQRESLKMILPKIPKIEREPPGGGVKVIRKPYGVTQHAEYLSEGPKQSIQRRRADPRVTFSGILEQIFNSLKADETSKNFYYSVSKKQVPDYYKIVKRPMDLQTIRANLTKNHYVTREDFLKDVRQIFDNSRLYNGDHHPLTASAKDLFELALKRITEKEQKLMKLEKAINPLLDDNDLVAFCYILESIINECKKIPKSFIFHQPVDKKKYKNYQEKIGRPMDLGTMEHKCKRHLYHSVGEFMRDVEQIYKNSDVYNGPNSAYTLLAKEIMETAHKLISQNAQHLAELEKNMQASLKAANEKDLDAAETGSPATAASSLAGDVIVERQIDDDDILVDEGENDESTIHMLNTGDEGSLLQQDLLLSDGEEDRAAGGGEISQTSYTDFSVLHSELNAATNNVEDDDQQRREEQDDVMVVRDETSRLDDEQPVGRDPGVVVVGEDGELFESANASDSESRMGDEELAELLDQSAMARSGRLHTDLAMSDSDDEEDGPSSSKRMRTMSTEEDCDFSTM